MSLLIDENVPESVTQFFRDRGHTVKMVRELFPAGTPDPVIATKADELEAIVVTWNHKDFKALAARVPKGNRQRFDGWAGSISGATKHGDVVDLRT